MEVKAAPPGCCQVGPPQVAARRLSGGRGGSTRLQPCGAASGFIVFYVSAHTFTTHFHGNPRGRVVPPQRGTGRNLFRVHRGLRWCTGGCANPRTRGNSLRREGFAPRGSGSLEERGGAGPVRFARGARCTGPPPESRLAGESQGPCGGGAPWDRNDTAPTS